MYKELQALTPEAHRDWRVPAVHQDWRFAAGENLVPLIYSEVADAAREFPLVFMEGKPLVYALLGLESGVNAYVGREGDWRATYQPARLRAYPFGLSPVGEGDRYALVLDAAYTPVGELGESLFDGDDKPTAFVQGRLEFLKRLHQGQGLTERLVSALRDVGVLVPLGVRVRDAQGQMKRLEGVEQVDEKALNGLDDARFNELRRSGALPLAYASLLSLANMRLGPIAGHYRQMPDQGSKPEGLDMESLFGHGDDLSFDFH
ncbi:SapC family protein [Ectothiorhodospira variabilis]|uniref:SapC family protein n=1 Tax=Ectothiorhodospira variabilis TaxID=505694 RepID=UPI001EFAC3C4|nr:SapC family protein [Ectothiorhodospira variabilis]MCG5498989.1 SapC family protein [Ectothiorhodospira variabilis]